ncbi:uncharacterized protein FA14DRAFT_49070 [Meira miltonrushii]|uniref:Uncharacterized protein n=1 Tax=Meira miltonrushii TaxID=1280837 RepID=A0A316VEI3_9BASI|nr:uncharacterized protein FA14DRAFT_49070 [Meira miltonrushii]PWN35930.1 hypothetical protein FA14DRAFT_49070 [Meira miltonrushii]
MRCKDCGEDVKFVAETFGALCSSCGAIQEEEVFLVPSVGRRLTSEATKQQYKNAQSITGSRIASFHRSRVDEQQSPFQKRLKSQDTQRLINGILNALDRPSLGIEARNVLSQAQIAQSLSESEQGATKDLLEPKRLHTSVCAACFIVVHKRSPNVTLSDVCKIADQGLGQTKTALNEIERLLAKVVDQDLNDSEASRDTASTYFEAQIQFILDQMKSSSDKGALMNKSDEALCRRAGVGSKPFRKLADQLSELCAHNGLFNRSGKKGALLDLGICSWAILMLTIEAKSGEPCSEKRFAELAIWAPGWQVGKKMNGYTKAQLGFEDYEVVEEDVKEDRGKREEARRSAIKTVSTLVHFKYSDICRLVSAYIRCLPWYDEIIHTKKPKGNRKASMKSIEDKNFPDPLPRKIIIAHLHEVIKLRNMLEKSMQDTLREQDDDTEEEPGSYGFLYDALLALSPTTSQSDQRSVLARSIGSTLLTIEALQEMDDQIADQILFREGELSSYISSAEEVAAKRVAFAV